MRSQRGYRAFVVGTLILSVSVTAAAVSYSRGHGAARVRHALFQPAEKAIIPNMAPSEPPPADALLDGPALSAETPAIERDSQEDPLRSYTIRLTPEGKITGRFDAVDSGEGALSPLTDVRVLFLQHNEIVHEVRPEPSGAFATVIAPGVYTVVATGPLGYATYAFRAIAYDAPETADAVPEEPGELHIETQTVPAGDFPTLKRLALAHAPRTFLDEQSVSSEIVRGRQLETPEPPAHRPMQTSLWTHQVEIQDGGQIVGRLRRLDPATGHSLHLQRTNVFLIRNNSVMSQASASQDGFFRLEDVSSGSYSFVAVGLDGLVAFSFQAVDPSPEVAGVARELTLVSMHKNAAANNNLATASMTWDNAPLAGTLIPAPPGAFFGGGGGAGGGGAGGGGLLGSGLIGAALIGGGALIGNELNNDNKQPPSPAGP